MSTHEPAAPRGVEIAVVPGIEDIATDEINEVFGEGISVELSRPGTLVLPPVPIDRLLKLRTAGAVYLVRRFAVSRPRALLGDQAMGQVTQLIRQAREGREFRGLRLSAAGAETPVMRRFRTELAERLHLEVDDARGDLVVRVYPGRDGWNVAVRVTPRPLSARSWRVPGFAGALESTVAAAMVRISEVRRPECFVDLCCGSATIAVEGALTAQPAVNVAVDLSADALIAAGHNVVSAGVGDSVALVRADVARVPLASSTVGALCSNPPWGHQMGSHVDNRRLYPALLAEAARLATPDVRFILLSHEVRLTEGLLRESRSWYVERERRLDLGGHHPRLWTLRRRDRRTS